MISLIIPPKDQVSRVQKMLAEEYGTASNIKSEASSGSHLDADDLQAETAEADASSGAHIELNVNKQLSASASSGGHIHYKGNALIKDIDTSSGGAVSKK